MNTVQSLASPPPFARSTPMFSLASNHFRPTLGASSCFDCDPVPVASPTRSLSRHFVKRRGHLASGTEQGRLFAFEPTCSHVALEFGTRKGRFDPPRFQNLEEPGRNRSTDCSRRLVVPRKGGKRGGRPIQGRFLYFCDLLDARSLSLSLTITRLFSRSLVGRAGLSQTSDPIEHVDSSRPDNL